MAPHAHVPPARRPHTVPAPPQSHGLRFQPSTITICCSARRSRARLRHDVHRSLSPTSCARPCLCRKRLRARLRPAHPFLHHPRSRPYVRACPHRARAHALLGGCKHIAHDVLPWLRARVRGTSIALGRFCTWPQPTALCIGADARSRAHVPSPPRPLPDHCHLWAWLPHLPFRLARAVCRGGERADTRRTRCLLRTVLTLTARAPVHQEALLVSACSHYPIAPAGSWAR